jgi:hypothetical protein
VAGYYLGSQTSNMIYKIGIKCPPGQETLDGTTCIDCQPRYYSNNETSNLCQPCQYSTFSGAANCQTG